MTGHISFRSVSEASQTRAVLGGNWVFQLFRSVPLPAPLFSGLLVLALFAGGMIASALSNCLTTYFQNYLLYVLLSAIFFGTYAFGWFIDAYPKALDAIRPALKVSDFDFQNFLVALTRYWVNNNPILALGSVVMIAVGLSYVQSAWYSAKPPEPLSYWINSTDPLLFHLYFALLIAVCGVILGTGGIGYILSIVHISGILRYPLHIPMISTIGKLKDLFAGLVVWGSVALIHLILLTFRSFQPPELVVLVGGIVVLVFAYFGPQWTYHRSVKRAQEAALNRLAKRFRDAFDEVGAGKAAADDDDRAMERVLHIRDLISFVASQPTWLLDLRTVIQLSLSAVVAPTLVAIMLSVLGLKHF